MTFLAEQQNRPAIEDVLKRSDDVALAVAFWGQGAQDLLANVDPKRQNVRLICDLEMGATNPKVVRDLARKFPFAHFPGLHAKVFAGEHAVVVGSANASSNGLALEDQELTSTWQEAALYSEDAADVAQCWQWFEQLWAASTSVLDDPDALERAREKWAARQKRRPRLTGGASLLRTVRDYPSTIADRLWFAIVPYRTSTTREADEAAEAAKPEHPGWEIGHYEYWDGIDQLPQGAEIVELWYDAGGRFQHAQYGHQQLLEGGPRYLEDGNRFRLSGTLENPENELTRANRELLAKSPLAEAIWRAAYGDVTPFDPTEADEPGVVSVQKMRDLLITYGT